jgi:hypothetical protein
MRCPICNAADALGATEHVMPSSSGTVRAAALEGLDCGTVVLDEVAPHSDQELAAVREAQNLRLNIIAQGGEVSYSKQAAARVHAYAVTRSHQGSSTRPSARLILAVDVNSIPAASLVRSSLGGAARGQP